MLQNQYSPSVLSFSHKQHPEVNVDRSCTNSVSQNITYTYEALTSRLYQKPGVQSNSTGIVGADWLGVTDATTNSIPASCVRSPRERGSANHQHAWWVLPGHT